MASLVKRPTKSGPVWYIQFYRAGKQKRVRASDNYQIAKEKLRRFESAQARGDDLPLTTRTPIAEMVQAYATHVRATKTVKSAQTDIYYLRDLFGPVCDALKVTSRKVSEKARKRPPRKGADRRQKAPVLEADCFERISTADIAAFISTQVARRGLAPKTANRYREILTRVFNWAVEQNGIRLPYEKNPAAAVERYREPAPTVRFLSLKQVNRQLASLAEDVQMQAMVATRIYAGLRREELLWLTWDDLDLASSVHGLIRVRAKTVNDMFWQPKTKKNRAVPVSSSLRLYLDKWRLTAQSAPAPPSASPGPRRRP